MNFDIKIPGVTNSVSTLEVASPYDGGTVGTVAIAGEDGAEQALANAYEVFAARDNWLPAWERTAILAKTVDIIKSRYEEILTVAVKEGGKPYMDSRIELDRAIDGVKNSRECIRNERGREIAMNYNPASAGRVAFTRLEPIGPVLAFSAFNHPVNLIVHQIMPAVASGCPVIIKPASDTPLSAFLLVDILREAGLPEKWCQPLVVESHAVGDKILRDERIAFFSFIGSGKVGWKLRSRLAPGTRYTLEHGGAAPVLICDDADIDELIPLVAKGGMYHAGQVCVSVQRVFAAENILDEFIDKLCQAVDKYIVGDPLDPATEVGPLIRKSELERVEQWISEAGEQGSELLTGGKRLSGSLFTPTILLNPPDDSKVSKLEIFGPVICVYSFSDMDDAIARANRLPFSFQASVFTRDINRGLKAYRKLNASAVMINDHSAFRVDWMPFAGLKQSGYGVGGIPYTYRDMTVEKMAVIKSKEL